MLRSICVISLLIISLTCKSQEQGSFEQYLYTGGGTSSIVPKLYYQTRHNWFGEVRYNYEELEAISFIAGKTFSNDDAFSYAFSPYAGLVMGSMNGGSLGSNIDFEFRNLFFSSESQYTFSVNERAQDFFFNWSEAGYKFTSLFYSGLALQLTHPFETQNKWEPGLMLGLTYKNWTFPFYAFSPTSANRNYVLGINWEWDYKKPVIKNYESLASH